MGRQAPRGRSRAGKRYVGAECDYGWVDQRNRNPKPSRITDAAPSRREQIRRREVRYISMMMIRVICLVLATILVYNHAPLLWLWIPILLFGMLVVPWMAVILANDRPPKEQHRLRGKLRRHQPPEASPRALTSGAERPIVIIDAEPDDLSQAT